ncbi:MAG: DUF58 domain-containing protein [Phycisphaerales bacterium]
MISPPRVPRAPGPARPAARPAHPPGRTGPEPGPRRGQRKPPAPRRRYHFYLPGALYVAVTLFIALGAINSQNNLLFAALGLAIGGLLISGFISGGALMGVRVQRSAPATIELGDPLPIVYRVSNANRLIPAFALHLTETPRDGDMGIVAGWPAFTGAPHAFAIQVPPRGHAEARTAVIPRRRGRLTFDPLRAWTTFPFGLVKKSITFSRPQSTIVRPPILPLRPGLLRRISARSPQGSGSERAPGIGEEFFGLREYVPGDSPRRIAWKRSARTGELVVRQNASPAPQRVWIVLTLLPAGQRSAARLNERAISLAASVLSAAARAGIAVGLAIPAAGALSVPRLGPWHADRLLAELALLEPLALDPHAAFPEAASKGGACVVISAGPEDTLFGPRHALRFGAQGAERCLADDPRVARILALLDSQPDPVPERPPLWRRALRRLRGGPR